MRVAGNGGPFPQPVPAARHRERERNIAVPVRDLPVSCPCPAREPLAAPIGVRAASGSSEGKEMNDQGFAHERLDAYRVAHEFVATAARVLRALPRGERHIGDQLRRAGDSVLLNLCEGAGRIAPKEKAHFYEIARGSGTECAGALAIVALRELAPAATVQQARELLHRAVSMLTVLARSARSRAG